MLRKLRTPMEEIAKRMRIRGSYLLCASTRLPLLKALRWNPLTLFLACRLPKPSLATSTPLTRYSNHDCKGLTTTFVCIKFKSGTGENLDFLYLKNILDFLSFIYCFEKFSEYFFSFSWIFSIDFFGIFFSIKWINFICCSGFLGFQFRLSAYFGAESFESFNFRKPNL